MLYIIVGPSGSGKTTFIELAKQLGSFVNVISIDVYSPNSRIYEDNLGRKKVSLEIFNINVAKGSYSFINEYDNCKYGYNIPSDYNDCNKIYLLDYPGEYPECNEFSGFSWSGILILPLNSDVLRNRLIECDRGSRIERSIKEFEECILDIENKRLNDNWSVIYNDTIKDLKTSCKNLLIR